ncbi:DNA replication/repair protein RecF [Reyranella sp.]|jgi:DNA replication and repair protein RecF|uniref:DNA replication/repair protein RecF n=1 Tax=Reyranella sp. TaxID=1929291 RepID=UPI000BCCB016|nr:DNA replication/repair protein RecF [Reyranella sp.]OYY41582.1 MAG: DNA replication/repair protein RecF [Rhodospirillales bacterium 35-66-84]OYZ93386.1 MAG: DNA replication/repair protein RecF [Rhodospirillales bacterium 24-66-33]OZB24884.1 MAG: DNA replication/repair protein RecF [Rhodospirillales bacterium 39-66-50]HQS15584.1 DNA replication/repair protein RecF [Reyranella sp.]HQT12850.1 DNA replication/repair protein RecF [Reyranella sp.]
MTAQAISALAYSSDAVSGAAPALLAVRQLRLTHFRNYRQLRLDCGAEPVVLVGANGAGKTNLLEALSYLAPGRGLRRARLEDVCCRSRAGEPPADGWAVAATLDTPDGRVAIGTGLEAGRSEGGLPRRVVRIDGRPMQSQTSLGGHVAAVWLTPQLDRLFLDGASERRRFLDRLVTALHPEHAGDVAAYENAMRQRARLLADGRQAGNRDPHWFTALEDTMARHGVALAAARADTVQRLDAAARLGVGPFPRASLAMAGEVDGWLATMAAIDVEDRLRRELAATRSRDADAGTTACGPHRSDLAVRHLDLDLPAAEGSTGQQKAVLVSIALAHARLVALARSRPPLLLLDEIAAHLDAERRLALFDEVVALGVQSWMTGTDAELFAPLAGRAQILRVADGSIAAV